MASHPNDFKQVSTQNLSLLEARALYHKLPPFRKDQEQQVQFLVQLQDKIESEMSKPQTQAPPSIVAKKKVIIKKKKDIDDSGAFLEELLAKRKKIDGGGSVSSFSSSLPWPPARVLRIIHKLPSLLPLW